MSTRSTTHFGYGSKGKTEAIIYRHSDGYPEAPGHGAGLIQFFADVKAQAQDTRFGDPSYLAAKLVVWLARQFATDYGYVDGKWTTANHADTRPMDFISVGVVSKDPGDIEYRYVVDCSTLVDGRPTVHVFTGYGNDWKDMGELADVLKAVPA